MPRLSSGSWGRHKPPCGTRLDRSHRLAPGMAAAWLFAEGGGLVLRDSCGPADATFSAGGGEAWTTGPGGPAHTVGSSSSGGSLASSAYVDLPGALSMAFRIKATFADANHFILGNDGSGWEFGSGIGGGAAIGCLSYNPGGGSWAQSTGLFNDGAWHHGGMVAAGSTVAYYKDGLPDSSTASSAPSAYTGVQTLGARTGGSFPLNGTLDYLYVWRNRALTAADFAEVARDPYGLFVRPSSRRYFFVPGAAPAGGPFPWFLDPSHCGGFWDGGL